MMRWAIYYAWVIWANIVALRHFPARTVEHRYEGEGHLLFYRVSVEVLAFSKRKKRIIWLTRWAHQNSSRRYVALVVPKIR